MATNWLTKLFSGGANNPLPGNSNPYGSGGSVLGKGTSIGSAYRNVTAQANSRNAYADRMTAMANYYRNANARGVAQVRAVDNMQPRLNATQDYFNQYRSNQAAGQRYQAQVDYRNQYAANALRGFQAAGQRLTGQAADWMAQNAFNFGQPQPPGNQYAGGYGSGYGSGYGEGGGYAPAAATVPDWYQSFLNPVNWRI